MKRPIQLPLGATVQLWHLLMVALLCVVAISGVVLYTQRQANLDFIRRQRERERLGQGQQRAAQSAKPAARLPFTQCLGKNKTDGRPCGNVTHNANSYCWLHQGQAGK